jgi:hypothetical protein
MVRQISPVVDALHFLVAAPAPPGGATIPNWAKYGGAAVGGALGGALLSRLVYPGHGEHHHGFGNHGGFGGFGSPMVWNDC